MRNSQKPAAPAQPAVSTGGGQNLPPSAAVPGTGPSDNQVGSDADPNTPGLQGPGAPGARVNANGVAGYGRDLASLNTFTQGFLGEGYEIADVKAAFTSNDLPGQYKDGRNTISTGETGYELEEAQSPTLNNDLAGAQGLTLDTPNNYTVGEASVPGTVGRSDSAQEGASAKPDIAESVRTIRMSRGGRDNDGYRGFRNRQQNEAAARQTQEEAPDPAKVAEENRRNQIRRTFLDFEGSSVKAAAAANAVAGYGKNSDGQAVFNYGGELVTAKDGMESQARNAAMSGKDPSEFLAIKLKEVQKDQEENM